ncbi:hypothetical protein HG531_014041 [Fusarium graminearum]|nr:hypothetical protein HG531_014041 [Fusarium graminearum]
MAAVATLLVLVLLSIPILVFDVGHFDFSVGFTNCHGESIVGGFASEVTNKESQMSRIPLKKAVIRPFLAAAFTNDRLLALLVCSGGHCCCGGRLRIGSRCCRTDSLILIIYWSTRGKDSESEVLRHSFAVRNSEVRSFVRRSSVDRDSGVVEGTSMPRLSSPRRER